MNPNKIRQLRDQIESLEATIQTHETRIAVLAQMLASSEPYRDRQLFRVTLDGHDQLPAELARFMADWETLQAQ